MASSDGIRIFVLYSWSYYSPLTLGKISRWLEYVALSVLKHWEVR